MPSRDFTFLTTGYTDATHVNSKAANILAHADIETVSVIVNIPEINMVGWYIASTTAYSGDDNDFLTLVAHLLLVEGYLFSSIPTT
jgi:hypothetical protein